MVLQGDGRITIFSASHAITISRAEECASQRLIHPSIQSKLLLLLCNCAECRHADSDCGPLDLVAAWLADSRTLAPGKIALTQWHTPGTPNDRCSLTFQNSGPQGWRDSRGHMITLVSEIAMDTKMIKKT